MKQVLISSWLLSLVVFAQMPAAQAAIPVIDNEILTKKSNTQGSTTKTVPVQDGTKSNTSGIDCATHKGNAKATSKKQAKAEGADIGRQVVKLFGGDPTAQQSGSNIGSALGALLSDQTGQVVGSQIGIEDLLKLQLAMYQTLSQNIGKTDTVKGSYDQNSIIAVQNGMAWNNDIDTANALVQALNLANTNNVSLTSAASGATSWPKPVTTTAALCIGGTSGQGTQNAPCATSSCLSAGGQATGDAGCITSRFRDSYDNVIVYLTLKTEVFNTENTNLTLLN